jgi:hypothetical protein
MQQILVLNDENNFILNCKFHVLYCVGRVLYDHSLRYPHRKKSGTVMVGERAGHGMSLKREITLWKRLRTTSMLQYDYLARFVPYLSYQSPGCVNVAELSDVDCAEVIPLSENFITHSSWSTMRSAPYTFSVFKLTYQQQNPVA